MTEEDRLWMKVEVADCWWWTGAPNGSGYGTFKRRMAHRWVWEHLVGPIPEGMEIDHLCRNRLCVNPDHLEVVTHQENIRRGWRRYGRDGRCPQGHSHSSENTYVNPNRPGRRGRQCRVCDRDRKREARRK